MNIILKKDNFELTSSPEQKFLCRVIWKTNDLRSSALLYLLGWVPSSGRRELFRHGDVRNTEFNRGLERLVKGEQFPISTLFRESSVCNWGILVLPMEANNVFCWKGDMLVPSVRFRVGSKVLILPHFLIKVNIINIQTIKTATTITTSPGLTLISWSLSNLINGLIALRCLCGSKKCQVVLVTVVTMIA